MNLSTGTRGPELQPNGLLWRMHTDGSVWASWAAWDQLETESPLFVETVEGRTIALWGDEE